MNLKDLLGKTLDEATLAKLEAHVTDLTGQRDSARNESQNQRKTLKDDLAKALSVQTRLFEKLGIDSADDIDTLPDAKGQAEAVKQFESRLKKAETDRQALTGERDAALGKLKESSLAALLEKQLSQHEWIDRDVTSLLVKSRVQWDGEQALYQTDDGKTIPLAEGVTLIATSKPHLLKAAQNGGSGYRPGGSAGGVKNPFAKDSFNLTQQLELETSNPTQAAALKHAVTS